MIEKRNTFQQKSEKNIQCISLKQSLTNDPDKNLSKSTKNFQKIQIQIKNQTLDDMLKVYSWRSKTQLPIAKVMFYKVICRNPNESYTTVQVSYQSFPNTLSDIKSISLENLIYLLKQSIIGFQKLYSIFGSFLISNKMVALNKNNRCKVWINQNFSVNQPIDIQMFKNLSKQDFIKQLVLLFQKKSQKSKKTEELFSLIKNCNNFEQLIEQIYNFAKIRQIQITSSYKINQKQERKYIISKSPIKNANQMTNNSFISSSQIQQVPKFLNKSQIGKKQQEVTQSRIQGRRDLSRSVSRTNIRTKTPLNQGKDLISSPRRKINGQNPLKSFLAKDCETKRKQVNLKSSNDYSFQNKNKSSSPIQEKKNKNKIMGSSINSLSYQDIEDIFQGRSILNSKKNNIQGNELMKSDLKTNYTGSSTYNSNINKILKKKTSLFDYEEDRNMLESIVVGQDKPMKSSLKTFDLQILGKLGKTVGESCMPEDFQK